MMDYGDTLENLLNQMQWCLGVRNYNTPRIFKHDGRWVAVNSILYTEYSKVFVPIAEADTLEELEKKLKTSLLTRIKKWIRRIL